MTDRSSREKILAAIRGHRIEPIERPALDHDWITYDDPVAQFSETLKSVGGRCVSLNGCDELPGALDDLPAYRDAERVFSQLDAVPSHVDLDSIDDPHDLADLDFALLTAEFGVAENGAVWVTDAGLRHRVVYFITQHLALVVPATEIVHNMHQAYRRLSWEPPRFGVFISGPSKTADIEQSLVIGAHGPRSLTVFLV